MNKRGISPAELIAIVIIVSLATAAVVYFLIDNSKNNFWDNFSSYSGGSKEVDPLQQSQSQVISGAGCVIKVGRLVKDSSSNVLKVEICQSSDCKAFEPSDLRWEAGGGSGNVILKRSLFGVNFLNFLRKDIAIGKVERDTFYLFSGFNGGKDYTKYSSELPAIDKLKLLDGAFRYGSSSLCKN